MTRTAMHMNSGLSQTRLNLALYFVFFIAGGPALVYQVVWQKVLALYFGVDIYSTTITVSIFMIGLGVGSLLGGIIADKIRQLPLVYALIELAIGITALYSLTVIQTIGEQYAGSSIATLILADGLILFVPTALMGMTLPVMIKMMATYNANISELISRLYSINTLGASLGALVSAYLLIGIGGYDGAVRMAAWTNISLGLSVFFISFLLPTLSAHKEIRHSAESASLAVHRKESNISSSSATPGVLTLCAFMSGFIALALEIVLYRVISIMLHGTVYVFGTHLFMFLAGIAMGSWLAEKRIKNAGHIQRFAITQFGIAILVLIIFTFLGVFNWLPLLKQLMAASFFTYFHPSIEPLNGLRDIKGLYSSIDIFFWTTLLVFPFAVLMGYGFPNLLAVASTQMSTLGKSVGSIYLANILGSALGGIATGFFLLEWVGTEGTFVIVGLLSCALGGIAYTTGLSATIGSQSGRSTNLGQTPEADSRKWKVAMIYVFSLVIVIGLFTVFPKRGGLLEALHMANFPGVKYSAFEDKTGVVALRTQTQQIAFEQEEHIFGTQRLYIDGSTHGYTGGASAAGLDKDAIIALAGHPDPQNVLVIGLGDAAIPSAAANDSRVENLTIIELKQSLRKLLSNTTQGRLLETRADKVEYIVDDGRRWMLANPERKFDLVMMFPLHAAHAHSGSLFSREFLTLVKNRLKPGGSFFIKNADYFSTPATLVTVYNDVVRIGRESYLASIAPIVFQPLLAGMEKDELLSELTASFDTITNATVEVPVNTDYKPNSEYYLTYPWRKYMSPSINPPYASNKSDMNRYVADNQ